MIIIAILLTLAAIALLVVGYLGWTGQLPRNQWAGIRTKVTMGSDAVWAAAHRKAGPWLLFSGLLMLPGAVLVAFTESHPTVGMVGGGMVILSLFGVGGAAMTATDAARRAVREEVAQKQ